MVFAVYEFQEDKCIMALPISWVKNNMAPFASCARKYIKRDKDPETNWPRYEIKKIDDKIYNTYAAALQAEKILSEKTEIDSSDYMECTIGARKLVKRRTNVPSSPPTSLQVSDENDSFDQLPSVPVKRMKSCHNAEDLLKSVSNISTGYTGVVSINGAKAQNKVLVEENIATEVLQAQNEIQRAEVVHEQDEASGVLFVQNQNYTDYSNSDFNSNLSEQTVVSILSPDTMTDTIRNVLREELDKFKIDILNAIDRGNTSEINDVTFRYREFETMENFPLHTVEELKNFDEKLKANVELQKKFKYYIRQIGGITVKDNLRLISRMYSLELQYNISYTGREKQKFAVKQLEHIKILIETLIDMYNLTERDVIIYMQRYLHQTCDRIKAANKKKSVENAASDVMDQ